jgi:hypothetical protein
MDYPSSWSICDTAPSQGSIRDSRVPVENVRDVLLVCDRRRQLCEPSHEVGRGTRAHAANNSEHLLAVNHPARLRNRSRIINPTEWASPPTPPRATTYSARVRMCSFTVLIRQRPQSRRRPGQQEGSSHPANPELLDSELEQRRHRRCAGRPARGRHDRARPGSGAPTPHVFARVGDARLRPGSGPRDAQLHRRGRYLKVPGTVYLNGEMPFFCCEVKLCKSGKHRGKRSPLRRLRRCTAAGCSSIISRSSGRRVPAACRKAASSSANC